MAKLLVAIGLCAFALASAEEPPGRILCKCTDHFQIAAREAQQGAAEARGVRARAGNGPTPVVDVMVLYTLDAAEEVGGPVFLDVDIANHISMTNQLYIDNTINVRLRLVHTGLVNYTESGSAETDIGRLLIDNDGYMDEVPALRDQKGADLVCLLTRNTGNVGGVGYIAVTNGEGIPSLGYSVVKRSRIVPNNVTFIHELGHNMGCEHDLELDGPDALTGIPKRQGAFGYSYGWHFVAQGQNFDSVMSEFGGTRIPRFSSPNLTYLGVTTGIADKADNARSINNAAAIVAAFRPTVIPDDGSAALPVIDSSLDTDGDGFPDELELALNTISIDPTSTPFGGSAAIPQKLTLSKVSVKLNFAKESGDSVKLTGTLPVPQGFVVDAQSLVVDAGGAIESFTLDKKGAAVAGNNKLKLRVKSSKGIVAVQSAAFSVTLSKGTFRSKFADEGLSSFVDAKLELKILPVVMLFNASYYSVKQNLLWTARAGKGGSARQP